MRNETITIYNAFEYSDSLSSLGAFCSIVHWEADNYHKGLSQAKFTTGGQIQVGSLIQTLKIMLWEPSEVHVVTTSSYLVKAFNLGRLAQPKPEGWTDGPNRALWCELYDLCQRHRITIERAGRQNRCAEIDYCRYDARSALELAFACQEESSQDGYLFDPTESDDWEEEISQDGYLFEPTEFDDWQEEISQDRYLFEPTESDDWQEEIFRDGYPFEDLFEPTLFDYPIGAGGDHVAFETPSMKGSPTGYLASLRWAYANL